MLRRGLPNNSPASCPKAMGFLARVLSALWRQDRGGVAMVIGLSIIPVTLALGLAVDTGMSYNALSRLQDAVDSAALAGAQMVDATARERKRDARKFFHANYPSDYLGGKLTKLRVRYNETKGRMRIEATVEVPTSFMRIVGRDTVEVHAEADATQLLSGVELALVLDVTNSMNWADPSGGTKLEALRNATGILLDGIYGEEDEVDNVSISVVTYNSVVNIGKDRTDWLDDFDEDDFEPYEWKGCVVARDDTMDRDDTPLSSEKLTAMLWPPVGSYFNTSNDPNAFCPDSEVLPLTEKKSDVLDHIDALTADGATVSLPGFVWGWRTLSPRWRASWDLDDKPVDYGDQAIKKVIVFMTDGVTVIHPDDRWFNAYGFTQDGRLGTIDDEQAEVEVDDRLRESCRLAKEEGIQIYTVMYALSDPYVEDLFRDCASSRSHFFAAPDGDKLDAAFKSIAGKLVSLRLSR